MTQFLNKGKVAPQREPQKTIFLEYIDALFGVKKARCQPDTYEYVELITYIGENLYLFVAWNCTNKKTAYIGTKGDEFGPEGSNNENSN